MSYKEDCNFRNKIKVCTFKEEDCVPEKCDMYNIEWDKDKLQRRYDILRDKLTKIMEDIKEMKKSGQRKKDPEGYKALKKERKDIVMGCLYISKAFRKIKQEGR